MTKIGYLFFSTLGIVILSGIYFFTLESKTPTPLPQVTIPTENTSNYANQTYGFTLVPGILLATTTFSRSYLAINTWSLLDSIETNNGDNVVAFTLPGSNNIAAAELRIGVSKNETQTRNCTTVDENTERTGTTTINGIVFHQFTLGDAAMSHYLEAKVYRTVHMNMCYTLEEVVTGTNPEVYDPPVTPPFSKEDAFTQLEKTVRTFTFLNI